MQKNKIPFKDDSSVASATTSSKSSAILLPMSGEDNDEVPNQSDAEIGIFAATSAYYSSLPDDHRDGGLGFDDHEPLPLEGAFSSSGKRAEPDGRVYGDCTNEDDEFLDYERVKRQRNH